jgi:hypothetical protein
LATKAFIGGAGRAICYQPRLPFRWLFFLRQTRFVETQFGDFAEEKIATGKINTLPFNLAVVERPDEMKSHRSDSKYRNNNSQGSVHAFHTF